MEVRFRLSQEKAKEAEAMKDCVKQQYRQIDVDDADYSTTGNSSQNGPEPPKADEAGFMNIQEESDEKLPFD